jgi:hypothetical protein
MTVTNDRPPLSTQAAAAGAAEVDTAADADTEDTEAGAVRQTTMIRPGPPAPGAVKRPQRFP